MDEARGGYGDLEGYQVYDRHYEKIGKVDDLFVGEDDRPEYIGVKMGLLGTKSTLIPVEISRINERRGLIEVDADEEHIKAGPTFGDDREITQEFERRVLNYYGLQPANDTPDRGAYGAYYPNAPVENPEPIPERSPRERTERESMARESTARESTARESTARESTARESTARESAGRGRTGRESSGATTGRAGRDAGRTEDRDELRVQRVEEELRAGTRERQAGSLNVRKRVRTERERIDVPVRREEVHIERVPVEEGRVSEGRGSSEPKVGDDEIRIPVVEEEVVVEKRPVVKEEIRIRKDVVEDTETVEADVRKEEVDIDDTTGRRDR